MTLRAVIPAAGFGTRMLPVTKSSPKEMLPVLEKPAIQYVVEEAAASGCDEIVIVTGRTKKAVEDHFDANPELENILREKGKKEALAAVQGANAGTKLFYVRQDTPKGLGHAVLQAEPLVRGQAFAVLLGDDIIENPTPVVAQLRAAHEQTRCSVIAVQRVAREDISKYGIVKTEPVGNGLHRVIGIVEKPKPEDAPSDLAVIGRYLFTPAIMEFLSRTKPGVGGEIQLTDAIQELLKREHVYCLEFAGRRYDVGNVQGWLYANLMMARGQPWLAKVLQDYERDAAKGPAGGAR